MSTKKVIRKSKTFPRKHKSFVRYRKEGIDVDDSYVRGGDFKELTTFQQDIELAHELTQREWQKAENNPEKRKKMMIDFIRAFGTNSSLSKKYRNKFFPKGQPDFDAFDAEVFKTRYVTQGQITNSSETAKKIRGFFLKYRYAPESVSDAKKEIEKSEIYSGAGPKLKERIKKSYALPADLTSEEYAAENKKITKLGIKLSKGAETELNRAIPIGPIEDKYQKMLENEKMIKSHLLTQVAAKNLTANQAINFYKEYYGAKLPRSEFENPSVNISREKPNPTALKHISAALEYGKPDAAANQAPTRAVEGYIRNDPELSTMPIETAIKALNGRKMTWNEIVAYNVGKSLSRGPMEAKLAKLGISITGLPPGKSYKHKKKKPGYAGTSYTGAGVGRKASTAGWLGGKTYSVSQKGEVRVKKEKGRISRTLSRAKDKTLGRIHPAPKERMRGFEKKYGEYLSPDLLQEDKVVMEKTSGIGGWFKRRLKEREAKRYTVDPNYRAKVQQKREIDRGIQSAKILKAEREAKAMTRAATSTWYGAFYKFSKYTKWIALTALIVAILFIPMGMFYVLGWALAVAVIALFQFIIWIFMEIWLLLAQAIVSIVGLIGQAFVMLINWLGGAFGGFLGQEYKPFEHQLVQNMLMFERDAAGNWVVSTAKDTSGLTDAQIAAGMGKQQLLTWGALNLTPPSFLNLDLFKPTVFDTDTIIAKIFPPIADFFKWMYTPIAERYTAWMTDPLTPWYWPGVVIGIPAILIIAGIIIIWRVVKIKYQTV